ncbi:hypothetical protein GCM10027176_77400 [Actinoallomurus bryophytorum]|uniref:HD domain-containing protein n=1 Tax=Actinoallomurus bryophytorum TaxID=1490222 RepID=A0A543C0X1_9ACTN|nr:HD domain-containing protein [Actinoallomurus bryophytorum]TQL90720.1 HD domain-containing protein [Actinoallomurus bryophytorum]
MDDRPSLIEPLLDRLAGVYSGAELGLVRQAYEVAARRHDGQLRKSGDPYITHPVAVATLAATVGLGCHLVCAALLHDLPSEPGYDPAPLRAEFGDDVVSLIEAIEASGAAVPWDDRVITLKLLDRLHNMRTIEYLDEDKQVLRSRHTLDLLVPHAQRLGHDVVADELQALARHRLRTLAGTVDGVERPWHVLWLGSILLPRTARRRYLEEWSAELQFLPDQRRAAFIRELVRGLPRLCVALRGSIWCDARAPAALHRAVDGLAGAGLATLRWLLRSKARPWAFLAPAVAWITLRTAQDDLGDALAVLITIPPALATGISRLRDHLGLTATHREDADRR